MFGQSTGIAVNTAPSTTPVSTTVSNPATDPVAASVAQLPTAPGASSIALTAAPVAAVVGATVTPANITPYTPAQVQTFQSLLNSYQQQLTTYYNTRSQMIADREAARFNYLQGWRFQFEFTVNQMANASANPAQFISFIQGTILDWLPMTDINGNVDPSYPDSDSFAQPNWGIFP